MNSLQQSIQRIYNHLSNDFTQTKSVFEEAATNHCSNHTKTQLFNKGWKNQMCLSFLYFFIVQTEWSKHQKIAVKELKHGLSSYCDISLYNLKIKVTMLEKLQVTSGKVLVI
jgi:hypothetical protein